MITYSSRKQEDLRYLLTTLHDASDLLEKTLKATRPQEEALLEQALFKIKLSSTHLEELLLYYFRACDPPKRF